MSESLRVNKHPQATDRYTSLLASATEKLRRAGGSFLEARWKCTAGLSCRRRHRQQESPSSTSRLEPSGMSSDRTFRSLTNRRALLKMTTRRHSPRKQLGKHQAICAQNTRMQRESRCFEACSTQPCTIASGQEVL